MERIIVNHDFDRSTVIPFRARRFSVAYDGGFSKGGDAIILMTCDESPEAVQLDESYILSSAADCVSA
jgi:hypothetical protein